MIGNVLCILSSKLISSFLRYTLHLIFNYLRKEQFITNGSLDYGTYNKVNKDEMAQLPQETTCVMR